ncbi:MAG: methionyl-tRNA formyltransferase [Oscillospiraceae bacterium]|nr:methionyl-tRNA formyltransferase [Oscillospiraceae bacterium]
MRVVFMGTPEFSVPCLRRLIADGHEVVGVFTQPDKPKGRGKQMTPPPVKVTATENGIPVFQPRSMRDGEALAILEQLKPDVIVVTAFGKILPKEILDYPPYGCINIHASLLPRYRGAAPIQWCVLNGETESGVTSMQMDVGLDTGDMLLKAKTPITPDMTAGELHDRLSVLGAEVLSETLSAAQMGELHPEKQDDALSNYAPMLTKELSPIDFTKSAQAVHNQIRGLSPWPAATMVLCGKKLKVHASALCGDKGGMPGEVMENGKRLVIACGDGKCVEILTVQAEGKRAMSAAEYLRGSAVEKGSIATA